MTTILTVMILAGSIFAQDQTGSADAFFKKGVVQVKMAASLKTAASARKKYIEAAGNFEKAIELNSEEAQYYLSRGQCFYKADEIEKAIRDFNAAIEIAPDLAEAYVERGKIFADLQLDDEDREETFRRGLTDFAKAIELDPENADFYYVRGQALFSDITVAGDETNNKLALEDLNKAISINSNFAEALVFRARIFHYLKDYEQALADSTKAVSLKPRNAAAFEIRGRTYFTLEKYESALADFTAALKLEPQNPDLYFYRSKAYEKLGKKAEAKLDKLQEEKMLKTLTDKLPEFRKQVFQGLSKENIEGTSLPGEIMPN